jgi:hypothetical protein
VSDFQALLLEGIFYSDSDSGALMLESAKEDHVNVIEALMRLNQRQVQISVHHLPPMPPDPTKQGGGCCLWGMEPRFPTHGGTTHGGTTFCPFGHHKEPTKLLNVTAQGTLDLRVGSYESETTFAVQKFDGTEVVLPFQHYLAGHVGRIAAATVVDIEAMKDALLKSGGFGQVEGLGERLGDLRDLLQQLPTSTGGKN